MRLVPNYLVLCAILLFKSYFASEFENKLTATSLTGNPILLAQRTAIICPNIIVADEETNNSVSTDLQILDENDSRALGDSNSDNTLPSSRIKPFTSAKKTRNSRNSRKMDSPTESSSVATDLSTAAGILLLPVDKPIPILTHDDSSESEEESDGDGKDGKDDLLNMIPNRFTVTETSGTYEIYEDEAFVPSADSMKKRSVLYRLLSEVYTSFDMFDFDRFMQFIRNGKLFLQHRDFRYHLVENLVQRSIKTTNEGTCQCLARLIEMIDSASVKRTVGNEEIDIFIDFEKRMFELRRKNRFSAPIASILNDYFSNEKKRLDPLQESLSTGDYESTKELIQSSDHLIFISSRDFNRILELPCSSARFHFISWSISNGHYNALERVDNELVTPLMLAAMCPRWSNDLVKAILWKAPDSRNLKNSANLTALDCAKKNKSLPYVYRKPLIEMLELMVPSFEALNEVLNKYISENN